MAKKGWYGDSARHSLAAKGIKSTVVRRRTFANYARANSLPLKLSEMTPAEASKISQTGCDGCQAVIKEAKKQKRMVVYNWETHDAVALGKKMSPKKSYTPSEAEIRELIDKHHVEREWAVGYLKRKHDGFYDSPDKSYSKKEARVFKMIGMDETPYIPDRQLAKLRRQVARYH